MKKRHGNLKWTPEIVAEWRELRKQGWKLKHIRDKYGATMSMICIKLGEQ